ncbi:tyrosine-type recombinase/integrase [Primorskyibacter flagellatus]|uniref:tyrosine-type recombinase/integrase n=1 Tax=Primorskyibacter flagellatus TaxID=1387277 RepID=UPI003A91899A
MPTKITQRTLASIEATGKRKFIRDTDTRGFLIEVSAKGKATFCVEKRIKGQASAKRIRIGDVDLVPLVDARQEAKRILLQASQGFDPRHAQVDEDPLPETLLGALQAYTNIKQHSLKASTLNDYNKTFSNCFSDWKSLPTRQLSKRMVQDRYSELLAEKSPAYVNKAFRNLSAILNFHDITPNPCDILTKKNLRVQSQPRNRFLSGREIYDIMQVRSTFKVRVANILLFFMLTGLRKSEVLRLTWADVKEGQIYIRDTKNRKDHVIPIVGLIGELLEDRRADNKLVFGYTESSLRTAVDKFKARHPLKGDWTLHDLRRTFSEHMNLIGYTEQDIAVANNQSGHGVTRKHYLAGQLAKQQLLKKMYTDLESQYRYYEYDHGGQVRKVPENWEPV